MSLDLDALAAQVLGWLKGNSFALDEDGFTVRCSEDNEHFPNSEFATFEFDEAAPMFVEYMRAADELLRLARVAQSMAPLVERLHRSRWGAHYAVRYIPPGYDQPAPLLVSIDALLDAYRAAPEPTPPLDRKRKCPACGRMTRITTAGCDHCDLEDK